ASDAVIVTEGEPLDGPGPKVIYVNAAFSRMTGYSPAEIVGKTPRVLQGPKTDRAKLDSIRESLSKGEPVKAEVLNYRRDGSEFWVEMDIVPVSEGGGWPEYWVSVQRDTTARREAEERYRTLVEQVPGITYIEDARTGATLYDSPQIRELLGYPADISAKDPQYWWRIVHPDDLERVRDEEARGMRNGKFSLEYRVFAKDGRIIWLRDEATVVRDEAGSPRFWRGFLFDVTERKRAERALEESEARLASVTSGAPVILFALDKDGRVTLAEGKGLETLGAKPGEHVGCSIFEKWKYLPGVLEDVRRVLGGEEIASTVEIEGFTFDARYSPVRNGSGEVSGVIGVATDITARRDLERELEHRAFHDPLTGLANRSLCMDRLSQALKRAARRGCPAALLFMDLDDFKVVNDSLGHDTGDELLIEVAARLRRCLRPGDTLARLGGDEFVVLIEDTGLDGAIRVANRVAELLEPPFFLGEQGHERFVTVSIGITVAGGGERRAEDLLREADLAMYRAKEEGKSHYEVFDSEMSARVLGRLEMEDSLRRALDHGQLEVHYQPVVSLSTGGIVGVEALVRWKHPERGLVYPADFIPLAEETGLIIPLGRRVIEESCRQLAKWREALPEDESIFLCINLSARQFRHPGLARDVSAILKKTGVSPEAVYLEVTESVAMAGTRETDSLAQLKRLGVGVMIDDFGTGQSSLSYLKKLPVDFIKVDRAFASGLGDNLVDREIVSAIVHLGHAVDLKIVAEGVESADQLLRLRELGCDYAQGYFFSEPIPAGEVADLLKTASLW
ncbi:MAG: EAL domain-containing protein, partial [Rubrobacteraceae bacterium]